MLTVVCEVHPAGNAEHPHDDGCTVVAEEMFVWSPTLSGVLPPLGVGRDGRYAVAVELWFVHET